MHLEIDFGNDKPHFGLNLNKVNHINRTFAPLLQYRSRSGTLPGITPGAFKHFIEHLVY
jgi:hypothetical protein